MPAGRAASRIARAMMEEARTIAEKLSAAREALSRMSPEERARITGGSDRATRSAGGTARDAAIAPRAVDPSGGQLSTDAGEP